MVFRAGAGPTATFNEIDGRVYLETGQGCGRRFAGAGMILVDPYTRGRSTFGRGQVILREPDGSLRGGSDRRADGCALLP